MPTAQTSAESFLHLIHRSRRGRLKIYLGYGPGVGKTYQMLLEGQRLKANGVDVVAGIVETHGRADTASLCLGLPEIPRRTVVYRGVRLDELDLQAVVDRRPEVVLVDELAHTNVPGSPNTKRYQDVLEIITAGIHVVTTLNIQHLESLYDTVERLIGVKVKERIPDWVIADADQIVNVDLATEDLRRRLEEGRVYSPERVESALGHFFRKSSLEQLRELTLREIASIIERKGRSAPGDERVQAPDQIVVCLSSRSPDAAALLRYGSRLAGKLNRTWYALYVQTPSENPDRLDAESRKRLKEAMALATQLGAMVFTFKGEDIADTILRFAREYRVGHLVVGRPGRLAPWQRLLGRRTPVERLIEGADAMSVVVVDELGVRQREESAHREPTAEAAAAETAIRAGGGTAAAPGGQPRPAGEPRRLSDLLTPATVEIFDRPLTKEELLRSLIGTLIGPGEKLTADDALRRFLRREEEGSTFLSEGIALPHIRVPELNAPRVALGLPRAGLAGGAPGSGSPEQVFLFLCPDSYPGGCLQLLATAARMFRDAQVRGEIGRAPDPQRAVELVRAWENRGAGPPAA